MIAPSYAVLPLFALLSALLAAAANAAVRRRAAVSESLRLPAYPPFRR